MDRDLEEYIKIIDFDKQYKRLLRKCKNKKVLFYGGGKLFQLINSKYDLSKLNPIGICDRSFEKEEEGDFYLGYKKIPIECIPKYHPDIVIVGTLEYRQLIARLRKTLFEDEKIKIRPLAYVPFLVFMKEALFD